MKKAIFITFLLVCFIFSSCQTAPNTTLPKSTEPLPQAKPTPTNNKDLFDYLPSMRLVYSCLKDIYKKYGTDYNFDSYTKQTENGEEIFKSGKNTIIVTKDILILSVNQDKCYFSSDTGDWVITSSFEKRAYEIFDAVLQSCPNELKCQSTDLENLFKTSAKTDINGNGKTVEYKNAGISYSVYKTNTGLTTITFGRTENQLFK